MIRTVLFWAVLSVSTPLLSLVSLVGGLLGAPMALHDWVHRRWSGLLLATGGVEVRAEGTEHLAEGQPAILACNHQSLFDIWALMAALPISLRFVAKEELTRIPVFARACRAAGHVFIDRSSPASAIRTMEQAGETMRREGTALVIFPEGTRSVDGELGRFKRGPFRLALRTGAAIHPVAVDGGTRILSKGGRRIRPGTIRIRVGPALSKGGDEATDRGELAREARERVEEMLAAMPGVAG